MNSEYAIYNFDLETPEGKMLEENIKASTSIRVIVNDTRGIELHFMLDHDKALRSLGRFLKESAGSNTGFINGRGVNSINVCVPEFLHEPPTSNNRFTNKENEVLSLAFEGESCKEIADHFQLKSETIRSHEKNAFVKVHTKNRMRALRRYHKVKGEIFLHDADLDQLLSKIGLSD